MVIDEAQFLTAGDVDVLAAMSAAGTEVICFGLRTDFSSALFEGARRLLELADKVAPMAIEPRCAACERPAVINARFVDGRLTATGDTVVIGDVARAGGNQKVTYDPMCYRCWRVRLGDAAANNGGGVHDGRRHGASATMGPVDRPAVRPGGQHMARMTHKPKKHLMLFSGRSHPALAEAVAAELDVALTPTSAYDFANGEIFVRFEESVRGADAFVLQAHTAPINKWIMEQLIMVDALKRASAKRITVVAAVLRLRPPGQEAPRPRADLGPADGRPVQDRRRRPADHRRPAHRPDPGLLRRPGRPPVRAAAAGRVRPGAARPASRSRWSPRTPAACAWPSAGPTCWAPRWRSSTSAATPTCPTRSRCFEVVGDVKGRVCVVVDDMIDTGGTIVKAAETLFEQGAKRGRRRRDPRDPVRPGRRSGWRTRRSPRSSSPTRCRSPPTLDKLTVLSIAPLLATAIQEVFTDGSVTRLFDPTPNGDSGH